MESSKDIFNEIKRYFSLHELVDKDVYNKYGDFAWNFFRKELLEILLFIRGYFDSPITINNWKIGGSYSQRGYRSNLSYLVKEKKTLYCSPHCLGAGVDFDIKGYTALEVREILLQIQDRLPYSIRLEDGVKWVHLDLFNSTDRKIVLFKGG